MSVPAGSSALSKDVLLVMFISGPDEEWISRVKSKHPGLEVRWQKILQDGKRFLNPEDLGDEIWDGVTLICPFFWPPAPKYLSTVRFVQLASAGIDAWVNHEIYQDENVVFCTTNGAHAPQIAEWVIGSYLSHQHHFIRYNEQMRSGHWESPMASTVQDCTVARMGVLGYGAIGRQCARIAKSMGMDVYAYTRSERSTPDQRKDDSFCIQGTGDPDGVIPSKWFHGASKNDINNFLNQDLDILVLSLPLTQDTKGLLSREQFEILSK